MSPENDAFQANMLEFMIEHIPAEFHIRKAMEECFELGEVLAKTLNKSTENRPSRTRIVEELADLMLRGIVVVANAYRGAEMSAEDAMELAADELDQATNAKLRKIQDWLKEGKLYNMKM